MADDDDISEIFVHSVFKVNLNTLDWLTTTFRNAMSVPLQGQFDWLSLADDDDISEVFVHSVFKVNLITLDWLTTTFRNAMSVPVQGQL